MDNTFDVFPSVIIDDIADFRTIRIPDELTKKDAIAFVTYLRSENNRIRYKRVDFNDKIDAHYIYCLQNIPSCTCVDKDPSWKRAESRMKKSNVPKKNTDVTLSFRTSNLFLVKTLFTFGLRKTNDKYHIFQTFTSPMIFYVPKETAVGATMTERTFNKHKNDFYSFLFQPNSIYKISPKFDYLIMTCYKSLFAVDVCTENVVRALEEHCELKDPLQQPYNCEFSNEIFLKKKMSPPPPPLFLPPPPPLPTSQLPKRQQYEDYLDQPPPSVMSLDSMKTWSKRSSDSFVKPICKKRKQHHRHQQQQHHEKDHEQQEQQQFHFYLVPEQSFIMQPQQEQPQQKHNLDELQQKQQENVFLTPLPPPMPLPPPSPSSSPPPVFLPSSPSSSLKQQQQVDNDELDNLFLIPAPSSFDQQQKMDNEDYAFLKTPPLLVEPPSSPPSSFSQQQQIVEPLDQPEIPSSSSSNNVDDEKLWADYYIEKEISRMNSKDYGKEIEIELFNLFNYCTSVEEEHPPPSSPKDEAVVDTTIIPPADSSKETTVPSEETASTSAAFATTAAEVVSQQETAESINNILDYWNLDLYSQDDIFFSA